MWNRLADNIIKQLAKTKVTLQHMEKIKGDGRIIKTPTSSLEVNAAVRGALNNLDVTKDSTNDIFITFSNINLEWTPSPMNTRVILNGRNLEVIEVEYSGFIGNENVCFTLRCTYER